MRKLVPTLFSELYSYCAYVWDYKVFYNFLSVTHKCVFWKERKDHSDINVFLISDLCVFDAHSYILTPELCSKERMLLGLSSPQSQTSLILQ